MYIFRIVAEHDYQLLKLFSATLGDLFLTHLTPKLPSCRKQSLNLQSKSIDWFLHDGNFGV